MQWLVFVFWLDHFCYCWDLLCDLLKKSEYYFFQNAILDMDPSILKMRRGKIVFMCLICSKCQRHFTSIQWHITLFYNRCNTGIWKQPCLTYFWVLTKGPPPNMYVPCLIELYGKDKNNKHFFIFSHLTHCRMEYLWRPDSEGVSKSHNIMETPLWISCFPSVWHHAIWLRSHLLPLLFHDVL